MAGFNARGRLDLTGIRGEKYFPYIAWTWFWNQPTHILIIKRQTYFWLPRKMFVLTIYLNYYTHDFPAWKGAHDAEIIVSLPENLSAIIARRMGSSLKWKMVSNDEKGSLNHSHNRGGASCILMIDGCITTIHLRGRRFTLVCQGRGISPSVKVIDDHLCPL